MAVVVSLPLPIDPDRARHAETAVHVLLLVTIGFGAVRRRRLFDAGGRFALAGMAALLAGLLLYCTRAVDLQLGTLGHAAEMASKIAGVALVGFALGVRGLAGAGPGGRADALLRSTFDSIAEPIVVIDAGCRIRRVNWFAELRFPGPLPGRLICETSWFSRDACAGCPVELGFATRRPSFFTVPGPDEAARHEVSAIPVTRADGRVTGQIHRVVDLGGRAVLQQRLRFLADVVASVEDAVAGVSRAGELTAVNPRGCALFGAGETELCGRPVADLLRFQDAAARETFRQLLATPRSGRVEAEVATPGGETRHVVVTIDPVRWAGGAPLGCALILRDVTDSRRAEEALRQSQKLSALGTFVSGLAHELNSPLTALIGAAAALAERSDCEHAGEVATIQGEAERCRRIVRGLLRFARRNRSEMVPTDLNRVVREAVELLGRPLAREGITLCVRAAAEPLLVRGDWSQLEQVLMNLLANARDAIRARGGTGKVTVVTARGGPDCVVAVADDGSGLSHGSRERLFDPFFTTKAAGEGTGLGLWLAQGIVRGHGGELAGEPRRPRGARFVLRLPALPAGQTIAGDGGTEERPLAAPSHAALPHRLLVVDDEPGIVEYLRFCFEALGHTVEGAGDVAAARERLWREPDFDLVFTDVRLADGRGDRLYRELVLVRPQYRGRFVFLTGDALGDDGRLANEGNRVLYKPFSREELVALLEQASGRACPLPA